MADLVVYYSFTGKSRLDAEWLAAALKADTAEIIETQPRDMEAGGIFRCMFDSFLRRRPPIKPTAKQVTAYDRVILTCPVWAARIAGPARTWLNTEGKNVKSLGLVLQSGMGQAYPKVLAEFEAAVGRRPDPFLTVSEADHGNKVAEAKVTTFAGSLVPKPAKFEKN